MFWKTTEMESKLLLTSNSGISVLLPENRRLGMDVLQTIRPQKPSCQQGL